VVKKRSRLINKELNIRNVAKKERHFNADQEEDGKTLRLHWRDGIID
jgi:hypothetical protein